MSEQNKIKAAGIYFLTGIISWILFFISFIFLTKSIMMFMEFDILALAVIAISLFFFFANYFILKFLNKQISLNKPEKSLLKTQHEILATLDRLSQIITLLVSIGLITAISTFIYISMIYLETNDFMYVIQPIPILFIIYLLFTIPSFYAITEITNLKLLLGDISKLKGEIKSKMI